MDKLVEQVKGLTDFLVYEGYVAYIDGYDQDDNPHAEGTDGQYGWDKGWRMAEKYDEPS